MFSRPRWLATRNQRLTVITPSRKRTATTVNRNLMVTWPKVRIHLQLKTLATTAKLNRHMGTTARLTHRLVTTVKRIPPMAITLRQIRRLVITEKPIRRTGITVKLSRRLVTTPKLILLMDTRRHRSSRGPATAVDQCAMQNPNRLVISPRKLRWVTTARTQCQWVITDSLRWLATAKLNSSLRRRIPASRNTASRNLVNQNSQATTVTREICRRLLMRAAHCQLTSTAMKGLKATTLRRL